MESTLTEQADKIILAEVQTEDDITELQKIKRKMTKLYSKQMMLSAEMEHNYDFTRTDRYLHWRSEKRDDGKDHTDTEAEKKAKLDAEKDYGKYREAKAVAQAMKAKMDAIKEFCMDSYVVRKGTLDASLVRNE